MSAYDVEKRFGWSSLCSHGNVNNGVLLCMMVKNVAHEEVLESLDLELVDYNENTYENEEILVIVTVEL